MIEKLNESGGEEAETNEVTSTTKDKVTSKVCIVM